MANCVFCNETKSTIVVKHARYDLPFCSVACSEALCSLLHDNRQLPFVADAGPKMGREAGESADESQDKRKRTERANRRAENRAAAMTRLTQVGWHSLPMELKIAIASNVPLRYFAGTDLARIDREWAYAIRPDPAVWTAMYARIARFLGAPEHHAFERIGRTPAAAIAYMCMRDYVIAPDNELLLLATGKKNSSVTIHLNQDTGTLVATPDIWDTMLVDTWTPHLALQTKDGGTLFMIDAQTGTLTRSNGREPPGKYVTLGVDTRYRGKVTLSFNENGRERIKAMPINASALLVSNGRPTGLISHPPQDGWLDLDIQHVNFTGLKVSFGQTPLRTLERLNNFALRRLMLSTAKPNPAMIDPSSRDAVQQDAESIRKLLRAARARATQDRILHITEYSAMFGHPSAAEQRAYHFLITIDLQLVALAYEGEIQPGESRDLDFTAVLAFDGPFSVFPTTLGPLTATEQVVPLKHFNVYHPGNQWPVDSTPSPSVNVKLSLNGLPVEYEAVDSSMRNLTLDNLGLDQAWFDAWKARDPARVNLRRGSITRRTLTDLRPVLGEIRFHETGDVTVLPMEHHYFHDHDRWVYLEPGQNPIAAKLGTQH